MEQTCRLEATARWHDSLQRLESLADWSPEKPENLDATLRDYQLDGFQWLARLSVWGVGGVLADDMGLGKTVQTLGVSCLNVGAVVLLWWWRQRAWVTTG